MFWLITVLRFPICFARYHSCIRVVLLKFTSLTSVCCVWSIYISVLNNWFEFYFSNLVVSFWYFHLISKLLSNLCFVIYFYLVVLDLISDAKFQGHLKKLLIRMPSADDIAKPFPPSVGTFSYDTLCSRDHVLGKHSPGDANHQPNLN